MSKSEFQSASLRQYFSIIIAFISSNKAKYWLSECIRLMYARRWTKQALTKQLWASTLAGKILDKFRAKLSSYTNANQS
jgi:hypothetical protein